jgi:hypothetical protein
MAGSPAPRRPSDREQIKAMLGDFDPQSSPHVNEFLDYLGHPRHKMILAFACFIADLCQLQAPNRIEKKSKELLLKWVHDHWDVIQNHYTRLTILADDGTVLSHTGPKGNQPQPSA